jgi:hypothetical protein
MGGATRSAGSTSSRAGRLIPAEKKPARTNGGMEMKKISISVNTLDRMERSGLLFSKLEEAQTRCSHANSLGNSFEVCEAYEMGDICKHIEHKVFRGYFLHEI